MAVIGHAEVIVKAITTGFEDSIRNDLKRISGSSIGRQAGQSLGDSFSEGFNRSTSGNPFGKFADGLKGLAPQAEGARQQFTSLVRTGYTLQAVLGILVGGVSSLAVSLGTFVGVLGAAAPAAAVLTSALVTLRVATMAAKFGFGDIAGAVKKATQPSNALGKSIAQVREEFQQLRFAAEDAALGERGAALNLEKALLNFNRLADLPPNSSARREAKLALDEAELAYRRAKDRTQDLNAEVAKGPAALNKAAAGSDPFAGLNEAQREFAKYLVTLKPAIDELELSVSKALLPPLKSATEILVKELLPILQRRLPAVAGQVGTALEEMVDGVDFSRIDRIFAGMTEPFEEGGRSNVQLFGDLLNNVLDIFLQITEATGPLLSDLLTFLVEKTGEFSETMEGSDLVKFFTDAGGYAADLGEIIGNVFTGLGNLIGLTTGPGSAGDDMVQWMKDATGEFATMFSEDPEAGKQFFKDAFANAESVLGSIGALLMEILKLADNPNIKIAFDQLKEGAPALGEMLGKMIDAGPSFATFLTTVTEIANKLTDDDQISAFFDTLNAGASAFSDFLDGDVVKRLIDNLGPIFATLSAIGLIFSVVKFGFEVLIGYLIITLGVFKPGLKEIMTGFGRVMTSVGGLAGLLKGPGLIGLFIILVTKAVEFYETFSDFKTMVDNTFGGVKESFETLMAAVGELFGKLFGSGEGSLLGALDPVVKFLLETLIPTLGFGFDMILNILTFVVDVANSLLDSVLPVITLIADALGALFEGDIIGFFSKLIQAFGTFVAGIMQFVVNGIIDVINLIIRSINDLLRMIANGPLGGFMKDVLGLDISGVQITELKKVQWLQDAERAQRKAATGRSSSNLAVPDRRPIASTGYSSRGQSIAEGNMRRMPEFAEAQKASINMTVNAGPGMNEKELASAVSRELAFQVRKGAI